MDDENKELKDPVVVSIDMSEIYEKIEKYIYKKLQERLREEILDDIAYEIGSEVSAKMGKIAVPDLAGRLEKLEDWKLDIEQGWIDIKDDNRTKKIL